MKNILFSLLLLTSFTASAQSEKWEYCTVTTLQAGFDTECKAVIDDGSKNMKALKGNEFLKNAAGETIFKSSIDVLNLLGDSGWECIEAQGAAYKSYLLKRRK